MHYRPQKYQLWPAKHQYHKPQSAICVSPLFSSLLSLLLNPVFLSSISSGIFELPLVPLCMNFFMFSFFIIRKRTHLINIPFYTAQYPRRKMISWEKTGTDYSKVIDFTYSDSGKWWGALKIKEGFKKNPGANFITV